MTWTPDNDIPDLSGKVILVTGGNTGLGKQAILELAKHKPAKIFLAARTASKAEAAIADIKAVVPEAQISHIPLDLMSFDSIQKAAAQVQSETSRLDILMNNAGIMATPPATTKEGYESQFGTNHIGHALFTKLLMPTLLQTAKEPNSDVRIINLSSEGHNMAPKGGIIFDNDQLMKRNTWVLYGQSKLANILFSKGLAKRYPEITSVAVHPGVIITDLYNAQNQSSLLMRYTIPVLDKLFFTKVDRGAYNQLWAATAPKDQLENGAYYKPVGNKGRPSPMGGYGRDEELVEKLWNWTEEQFKMHGY